LGRFVRVRVIPEPIQPRAQVREPDARADQHSQSFHDCHMAVSHRCFQRVPLPVGLDDPLTHPAMKAFMAGMRERGLF
jgi:hypothetical protein